jgi:hypothetical protein
MTFAEVENRLCPKAVEPLTNSRAAARDTARGRQTGWIVFSKGFATGWGRERTGPAAS